MAGNLRYRTYKSCVCRATQKKRMRALRIGLRRSEEKLKLWELREHGFNLSEHFSAKIQEAQEVFATRH